MKEVAKNTGILLGVAVAIVFASVAVVLAAQPGASSNTAKPAVHEPVDPPTVKELFDLTNLERAKAGVPPLQLSEALIGSAQAKAEDMVKYDYFAHDNPVTGKHGYDWVYETVLTCGPGPAENIAIWNYGITYDPAAETIQSFMDSPPHRDAMLNPNIDFVGFGVSGDYVVEHFCDPIE